MLLGGAEAHHLLDAGTVVPGPVEQHDLAIGRQVLHVALEVPLAAFRRWVRAAPRCARCAGSDIR